LKTVRLTDDAYADLTAWMGRVQHIRGTRVYLSGALQEAVRLADTHPDTDIATNSKELRRSET